MQKLQEYTVFFKNMHKNTGISLIPEEISLKLKNSHLDVAFLGLFLKIIINFFAAFFI